MKFKVLLIYPNTMMATLLPLSISSLSAYLKQNDIDVELFDTTFYRTEGMNFEKKKEWLLQVKPFDMQIPFKGDFEEAKNDLRKMANDYRPNLIGISLVEDTIPQGLSLLEAIRDYECPVVAGGVGATFNWHRLIREQDVDFVCVGEGEKILEMLCRTPKEDWWRLAGIADEGYLRAESDRIFVRPIDLDSLPTPDFSIFEENRLKRAMHGIIKTMLHVEIDRGCPFSCTYCNAPAISSFYRKHGYEYYRAKSVGKVLTEMKELKERYKPDYVDFNSESFLARPKIALLKLLHEYSNEIDLPFWCQSRLHLVDADKILALKMAGCSDMQFGIEHGNEKFREKYLNRKETNEQMLTALDLVEKYNIPYTVNNIVGWPDETRDLVWDTIRFNRQVHPKTMNCYMMTPYRGTGMYDYCVREGLMEPDAESMQLLGGKVIRYRHMAREEFLGLQRCFSLYARLPESWYPMIERAERLDEHGNRVFAELREIYIRQFYS
jgi:radical SAM superfamily enzyme YgiQ (UPF0313 family)